MIYDPHTAENVEAMLTKLGPLRVTHPRQALLAVWLATCTYDVGKGRGEPERTYWVSDPIGEIADRLYINQVSMAEARADDDDARSRGIVRNARKAASRDLGKLARAGVLAREDGAIVLKLDP